MNLERILCMVKQPELDWYTHSSEAREEMVKKASIDSSWAQRIQRSEFNQKHFTREFTEYAHSLGLPIEYVLAKSAHLVSFVPDLVLSLGGDGTMVQAIRLFPDTPILGVNNDYSPVRGEGSVGATLVLDARNYKVGLEELVVGRFSLQRWYRLVAAIDGEPLMSEEKECFATNEIVVRNANGGTTGGTLRIGGKENYFSGSSGPLFCTGVGSTAHYRNAGGVEFPRDAPLRGYLVRENNEDCNPRIVGIAVEGTSIEFLPERGGYGVFFDSQQVATLSLSQTLRVWLSENSYTRAVIPDCCVNTQPKNQS